MKQHITEEQLQKLTKKQKSNLIMYARLNHGGWLNPHTMQLRHLLSIGEMIEFLVSNEKYVTCDQWIKDEFHHWRVGLNWVSEDEFDYICEKEELCDALWMAVKEVIKSSNLRDTKAANSIIVPEQTESS